VQETKNVEFKNVTVTRGDSTYKHPYGEYYGRYEKTALSLLENEEYDTTAEPDRAPFIPYVTHLCLISHANAAKGHIPRGIENSPVTRYYPEAGKIYLRAKDEEQKVINYRGVPFVPELPAYAYMGRESSITDYFGWYDERNRYVDTHFNYAIAREVGPGGIYVRIPKTNKLLFHQKFDKNAKRDIGNNYIRDKTRWSHIWWEEVGPDDDVGFTRWCPVCKADVSAYTGEMKGLDSYVEMLKAAVRKEGIIAPEILAMAIPVGRIPFGHNCNETQYSRVWLNDVPIRPLLSKIDYRSLDKKYAPDNDLRIWGKIERSQFTAVEVPKVEDQQVKLSPDDLRQIRRSEELKWIEWIEWKDPETNKDVKEIMLENCEKIPKQVVKELDEKTDNYLVEQNLTLRDLLYKK